MVSIAPAQTGWFDWLQLEPAIAGGAEDLVLASLKVLEVNGRHLYLKGTPALTELSTGERRILEALARQGDTVFVAVGHPGQIQLSYRMPDLENAVAFDAQSLQGVIGQWCAWANSTES